MSDDTNHEQPSAGGRYIRQHDGSLVREQPADVAPADAETDGAAPAARSSKKGK